MDKRQMHRWMVASDLLFALSVAVIFIWIVPALWSGEWPFKVIAVLFWLFGLLFLVGRVLEIRKDTLEALSDKDDW